MSKSNGNHTMLDLFYDRRTRNLTTLSWTLVGVILLGMGLFAFKESIEAWLAGRPYAGPLNRRHMGAPVSPDIGAVISLFLVAGGGGTIYAGICQMFPAIEHQRWFRWITLLVFGTLCLLILALSALVAADRLLRL